MPKNLTVKKCILGPFTKQITLKLIDKVILVFLYAVV